MTDHQSTIDTFRAAFLSHYGRECQVVKRGSHYANYWVVDGTMRTKYKLWQIDQMAIELRGRSKHERLDGEPASDVELPF